MAKKKNKGEQMVLIEVGPKNLKKIVQAVRTYKRYQHDRLIAGKKEVEYREKVRELVKEADLQRLKNGVIRFEADNATVCVTPQDDLITIKEKGTKKKSTKDQVETEEKKHEAKNAKS